MAKPAGYFSGLSRNTFLLALASLFADISSEMLYPVLPVFLTQTLKVSGSVVGLVEGVAEGTQNIVQGLSGSLSDRLARRKPVALAGYAVAALCKPLIGLSAAWPAVLGTRFADRLATGVRSAPRDALVAASADDAHRGRAFGLEGAGDNAGAFLGPVVAVLLLAAAPGDLRRIFFISIAPALLAFVMVLLVREGRTDAKSKARLGVGLGRLPKRYYAYLSAIAVFGLGNSSNAFLILQTRALGASLPVTILIYAGFNLVAALVSYPAGAWSDKLGRRNVILLSLAVFFASYLGFAVFSNVAVLGGLFVLYGVYQGLFRTAGKAMAADLSPAELRAGGVGWYNTVVGLTGLIASVVAGQLWDHIAHAAVFYLGAAFAAIGAGAVLTLAPGRPEPASSAG